jgi:hypothetical protein
LYGFTAMVFGWQGADPVQCALLPDSADASNPILIDGLIVLPVLEVERLIVFGGLVS